MEQLRCSIGTSTGSRLLSLKNNVKFASSTIITRGEIRLSTLRNKSSIKLFCCSGQKKISNETIGGGSFELCSSDQPCENDENGCYEKAAKLAVHHYNVKHNHEFEFVRVLKASSELLSEEMNLIIQVKDGRLLHVYYVKVVYDNSGFFVRTWRTLNRLESETVFPLSNSSGEPKKNTDSTKYYQVLGVSKSASENDIRKAYHYEIYEKNCPEPRDPVKSKELGEALVVLADPKRRRIYDQYGEDAVKEEMAREGAIENFNSEIARPVEVPWENLENGESYTSEHAIEAAKLGVHHFNQKHNHEFEFVKVLKTWVNLALESHLVIAEYVLIIKVNDGNVPHVYRVKINHDDFTLRAWRPLDRRDYEYMGNRVCLPR